jgi:beta-lactamase regulating signal transducer with metallopeptidase domain
MNIQLETLTTLAGITWNNLLRASLQFAVFALLLWLVCRLLPHLPARTRCVLWWLATLKLLLAVAFVTPIALHVLPRRAIAPQAISQFSAPAVALSTVKSEPIQSIGIPALSEIKPSPQRLSWLAAGMSLWAAVVLWLAGSYIYRLRKIIKIAGQASIAPPEIQQVAAGLSISLGLKRTPGIAISKAITSPLVVGIFHPIVLLPAECFDRWSMNDQRMALCHEMLHLRHGDLWMSLIPALAEKLFFFHPLVHLAAWEYGLTKEAACDAAVLKFLDIEPADYGQLLLSFGVTRMPRNFAAAGAPCSFATLKRRIAMLRESSVYTGRLNKVARIITVIAICAILPVKFVARSTASINESPAHMTAFREKPNPSVETRLTEIISGGVEKPVSVGAVLSTQAAGAPQQDSDRLNIGWLKWEITEVASGVILASGNGPITLKGVLITKRSKEELLANRLEELGTERIKKPLPFPEWLNNKQATDLLKNLQNTESHSIAHGLMDKRIKLTDEFDIGMAEFPTTNYEDKVGFSITAKRTDIQCFSWEWFTIRDGNRAVKLQEGSGELGIDLREVNGAWEVTRTEFLTDISLRILRLGVDQPGSPPYWRIKIFKGSSITWPSTQGPLNLQEGPLKQDGAGFKVANLELKGLTLFDPEKLKDMLHIRNGDSFDPQLIKEGMKSIQQLFSNLGHIDFTYTPQIDINQNEKTVSGSFLLFPGRQYFVEKINLYGVESDENAKEIWSTLRAAGLKEKTVFNPRQLDKAIKGLNEFLADKNLTLKNYEFKRSSKESGTGDINIMY